MLGYPEGVKRYSLRVLGKLGIKNINSRDVVLSEFEMPYLKQKNDKCVEPGNENGVQSEVKLKKFNLSQPKEDEYETLQPNNINLYLNLLRRMNFKEKMKLKKLPTDNTSIQDYQLTQDREMME